MNIEDWFVLWQHVSACRYQSDSRCI